MTGRERLVAVARGGAVDPKPSFPTDGAVVPLTQVSAALESQPERLCLAWVDSLSARDLAAGQPILAAAKDDPAGAAHQVDQRMDEARADISAAFDSGADGFAYRMAGVSPDHASPMQYGGQFLESDRALLQEHSDARFVMLVVTDSQDPFLDFISDLPAHALAWPMSKSGIAPQVMRGVWQGALAGDHPEADISFDMEAAA